MSENFSDKDLVDLRDGLLAEIGRRIKDPKDRRTLTSSQLLSAAKELAKLIPAGSGSNPDGDLDLFELVNRLPPEQKKKHLLDERVRLKERLMRIHVELGED